jgi:hypothetical protein
MRLSLVQRAFGQKRQVLKRLAVLGQQWLLQHQFPQQRVDLGMWLEEERYP